jgi:RNA polymerase-binding transcription factor DksA
MQKLKKTEVKEFKQLLLAIRARLRGDVSAMADVALKRNRENGSVETSTMPIHMADLGSDNFEQEFTLSLLETEEDTLTAIESALERVEEGAFGICEECTGPIAKSRLQAIPYTPLCIKCATQREGR